MSSLPRLVAIAVVVALGVGAGGESSWAATVTPFTPQTSGDIDQTKVIFAPWAKYCAYGQGVHPFCYISMIGRIESGLPVVSAELIELDGGPKKVLRVSVPLGMLISAGTQITIDDGQPKMAPYITCIQSGCIADYEVTDALIDHLKHGRSLVLRAINGHGQTVSLMLPLESFGKAYDGIATKLNMAVQRQQ